MLTLARARCDACLREWVTPEQLDRWPHLRGRHPVGVLVDGRCPDCPARDDESLAEWQLDVLANPWMSRAARRRVVGLEP